MAYKILAINPGSTSTKIAIFEDDQQIFVKTIRHSAEEIGSFPTIASQFSYRKDIILSTLKKLVSLFRISMQSLAEAGLSNRLSPVFTK